MGFDHHLFDKAVRFVLAEEGCSVSMLQRQFKWEYFGARAMIQEMQNRKIVGRPQQGQFLLLMTLDEYLAQQED